MAFRWTASAMPRRLRMFRPRSRHVRKQLSTGRHQFELRRPVERLQTLVRRLFGRRKGQAVQRHGAARLPCRLDWRIRLTRRFAAKEHPVERCGCRGLREPWQPRLASRALRDDHDRRRTERETWCVHDVLAVPHRYRVISRSPLGRAAADANVSAAVRPLPA